MLKLLAVACLVMVANAGRTDKTLEDKAVGEEVVDAVVDLIARSGVFGIDYRFLLRLAFIESKFGQDPNTFAPRNGQEYNGGIWQVDSQTFAATQNSAVQAVKDLYPKISQSFGIDWGKQTWADCRKPLVSALAARLALTASQLPIPDTLEAQADYWAKNYNSAATKGTAQQFVDTVKQMEKNSTCLGRMDLAIVMDGSGSIGLANFQLASKFVADLISTFSLDNVNVGYVIFSNDVQVIFPLDSGLDKGSMSAMVVNASYPGQSTNTGGGITTAVDLLKKAHHREGIPHIMLVFTDGQSNLGVSVTDAMKTVAQNDIRSFAIGIGSATGAQELLAIAGGQPTHVLPMSSYQSLSQSFQMMNSQTCKIAQKPDTGKQVNDTLHKDEKRYFCFDLLPEGITVSIDTEVGRTESYYSYTLENPSSALNDGQINGQAFIASPAAQTSAYSANVTRVCVSVKGVDIQNNFTIGSDQGNHVTTPTPDCDDDFCRIERKAIAVAKKAIAESRNYIKVANEICEQLSHDYEKEDWICAIGDNVEVSQHQMVSAMFQFSFSVDNITVYVIVKLPD